MVLKDRGFYISPLTLEWEFLILNFTLYNNLNSNSKTDNVASLRYYILNIVPPIVETYAVRLVEQDAWLFPLARDAMDASRAISPTSKRRNLAPETKQPLHNAVARAAVPAANRAEKWSTSPGTIGKLLYAAASRATFSSFSRSRKKNKKQKKKRKKKERENGSKAGEGNKVEWRLADWTQVRCYREWCNSAKSLVIFTLVFEENVALRWNKIAN